ncbi:MAG: TonB family protein [Acidobacteriota bacterium]|nr:TonB family protein [Acidobacteriota bacterium]
MHEAVSDVLAERAGDAEGVSRTILLSLGAHVALIVGVVLMPASWRSVDVPAEVTPMMISLQGGTGPDAGGMTPISGRAVQAIAPPDAKPTPQPPPAPKAPEMVAPEVPARPVPPARPVEKPSERSSTRKPTVGPEIKTGDARADTGGAPIPFGGLTRPSGGGSASSDAFTDYANFCCPAYLSQMTDMIKRNWSQNQGAAGRVQVKFTISRDGKLSNVQVEKPSNISLLDLESQRAILKTAQLPPLPREFSENTLTVHLVFEYHR